MGLVQNDAGKRVPGGGLRDTTKSGMNISVTKLSNPPSGPFGVGSGSGIAGGGSLSTKGSKSQSKKK